MQLNIEKNTTPSLSDDKSEKVHGWNSYSDNYVSATAPNGYTVLASKSASTLSINPSQKKVKTFTDSR